MKSPDEIAKELEKLHSLPAGPNQSIYARGAIQALLWLTQDVTPPHDFFGVICSDPRSPA